MFLRSVSGMQQVILSYRKSTFDAASRNCATFCYDAMKGLGSAIIAPIPKINHDDVDKFESEYLKFVYLNGWKKIDVSEAGIGAFAYHDDHGTKYFSVHDGTKFLVYTTAGIVVAQRDTIVHCCRTA